MYNFRLQLLFWFESFWWTERFRMLAMQDERMITREEGIGQFINKAFRNNVRSVGSIITSVHRTHICGIHRRSLLRFILLVPLSRMLRGLDRKGDRVIGRSFERCSVPRTSSSSLRRRRCMMHQGGLSFISTFFVLSIFPLYHYIYLLLYPRTFVILPPVEWDDKFFCLFICFVLRRVLLAHEDDQRIVILGLWLVYFA